ncbi:MAG: hypothetical protein CSA18_02360 [Deltaproteobacteria bacterium]|nr:MAG: hypothetical protein CSB21_01105 [Deltaproteobacteria bacterium]PIE74973.1 MAG: hypothetical protein CSA18_02360 [Deltaproteobacteria bacterium]
MKILSKSNSFKKLIHQDIILKEFSVAFQQAIECIIECKNEMALKFKEEMENKKKEIDAYSKAVFVRDIKSSKETLLYLYINYEIQITEKMTSVMEWILARKSPINSDSIETELFVLADSAAETIDRLTLLSKEIAALSKRFKGKKNKTKLNKIIDEIMEKSRKTINLSLRMKRKILETESSSASIIHLVFLADMIGQTAEKTRDTAWLATALS